MRNELMNTRQQIAAMAMQGILSCGELSDPDKVADMAITYANKLIAKLGECGEWKKY